MPGRVKVAVLVGSLRRGSISGALADAVRHAAPADLHLERIAIGELPLYNHDLEADEPAAWRTFRRQIGAADALLFVTPEYNRSVPAALKNAIDVGSRPAGRSVWNGKPAAVFSHSPGAIGGFGANHHLRQSLVCLNVATMPAPEIYFSRSAQLLDAHGRWTAPETRALVAKAMESFARWIDYCTMG